MKHPAPLPFRPALATLALAAAGALALPAQAAWLGLADGTYSVNLNCDFSSVVACPGTVSGQLTIAGGGATAMDFGIDSLAFAGDPDDGVFESSTVRFERSGLSLDPGGAFSFLSLRYILSGSTSSYGVGDRYWIYCNNSGIGTCTPHTNGTWTARRIDVAAVPTPPSLALGLVALGLLAASTGAARRAGARAG